MPLHPVVDAHSVSQDPSDSTQYDLASKVLLQSAQSDSRQCPWPTRAFRPLPQAVHVVSSFVFSLFFPAAHVCVGPHVVLLALQAVVLLLYLPSGHVVQVPAAHFWPLPHEALSFS